MRLFIFNKLVSFRIKSFQLYFNRFFIQQIKAPDVCIWNELKSIIIIWKTQIISMNIHNKGHHHQRTVVTKIARHYTRIITMLTQRITLNYCPHNCYAIPTLRTTTLATLITLYLLWNMLLTVHWWCPKQFCSLYVIITGEYCVRCGIKLQVWGRFCFKREGSNVWSSVDSRLTVGVIWRQTADTFALQWESDPGGAGRGLPSDG